MRHVQASIKEFCSERLRNLWSAPQKKVFTSSAFVSGILAPSYIKNGEEDAKLIECDRNHYLQRVVARDLLYGSSQGRFYSVIVTKEERWKEKDSNFKYSCWFEKMLRFVNVDVSADGGNLQRNLSQYLAESD